MTNARNAHAVGAERGQLVIGGEPAEDEQDGGEQSPWNRKDERERQHVGDEAEQIFDRHIVVHEQGQEFAKNVAHHQNETEHSDGEENVDEQLAADAAVDQFHRWL